MPFLTCGNHSPSTTVQDSRSTVDRRIAKQTHPWAGLGRGDGGIFSVALCRAVVQLQHERSWTVENLGFLGDGQCSWCLLHLTGLCRRPAASVRGWETFAWGPGLGELSWVCAHPTTARKHPCSLPGHGVTGASDTAVSGNSQDCLSEGWEEALSKELIFA